MTAACPHCIVACNGKCKWQLISTAPKDGTSVLGFNAEWQTVQQVEWSALDMMWLYSEELLAQVDEEANPTHWMPVPILPT